MNYIVAGFSWYHVYSVKWHTNQVNGIGALPLFNVFMHTARRRHKRLHFKYNRSPSLTLLSFLFCMHTKYFSLIELISSIRAVLWLYGACGIGTHNCHMSRADFMHQWFLAVLSYTCSKSDLEEKSRVSFVKWTDSGSNARNRSFWT